MDTQIIDLTNSLWSETLNKFRHDIYHLSEYVSLEAQRNNSTAEGILITDDEHTLFLPYLLRRSDTLFDGELNHEVFDVVSPYGYPGFLLSESAIDMPRFLSLAIDKLKKIWRERQICSAFIRLHPFLNENFNQGTNDNSIKVNGETVYIDLRLDEEEIWRQTRPEHRTKINRCKRAGFQAKMVAPHKFIKEFNRFYEETMDRVGARSLYYFGENFFENLVDALSEKIHLCLVELNQEIACAGLFTECCGIVQYHLGGTNGSFLKQAPSTLMFDYARLWAKERGNEILHLGGGVGGSKEDGLYQFKGGFSKLRYAFMTAQLIIDEQKYHHLACLKAKSLFISEEELLKSNFFPVYRLPH